MITKVGYEYAIEYAYSMEKDAALGAVLKGGWNMLSGAAKNARSLGGKVWNGQMGGSQAMNVFKNRMGTAMRRNMPCVYNSAQNGVLRTGMNTVGKGWSMAKGYGQKGMNMVRNGWGKLNTGAGNTAMNGAGAIASGVSQ